MAWFRRLRARLRHRNFDDELRREIEVHRAMKEEELRDAGWSPDEARAQAARSMGNVTLSREDARQVWIGRWLESVGQDVRYGLRSLRRTPGFTIAALLTLTLGIGLNISFFSLASGLFLKPWPLPDPDTVVTVFPVDATPASSNTSAVEYRFLRDAARTVDLVAVREGYAGLGDTAAANRVPVRHVSGNYFDVLRLPLALGRGIAAHEDEPGRPSAVAVISHNRWRQDFALTPDVIGRELRLNDVPFTIVGVAAAGATDDAPEVERAGAWVPLATIPLLEPDNPFSQSFLFDPGHCCVKLAGRLRGAATHAQAGAELSALHMQFRQPRGSQPAGLLVTGTAAINQPGVDRIVRIFGLIFAGLGLVLVVACANVGNLQLARMMARHRELAIRQSLGAGRTRIVRQLLTEGLLLGGFAAAVALAGAFFVPRLALSLVGTRGADVSPEWRVLGFAVLIVIVAVAIASLAPALRATRRLAMSYDGARGSRLRLRSWFLAVQIALSALLLAGGTLLTRSVIHAATVDPGYAIDGVVNVSVRPPAGPDGAARLTDVMAAVRLTLREAGIASGEASVSPLELSRMTTGVRRHDEGPEASRAIYTLDVSPGYFDVLRMRIVAGRVFTTDDPASDVLINEALARQLWPGEPAVERTLMAGGVRRVVGVVADANLSALDAVEPTLFRRATGGVGQLPRGNLLLPNDPAAIARVRETVARIEPAAVVTVRPLSENLRRALELPRLGASIAVAIALLGVLLSGVGVFGVFAYAVADRTREIGIRMALGARGAHVLRLLFRQTATPLAGGLVVGLAGALLAAPVLRSYLLGISPYDPLAFLAAAIVLSAAAFLATLHPARRAVQVDPAVTLRHE
jgi:predicted permease